MQNQLVTVFGGGGFLGRYVCEELLKAGWRIRIAERDPSNAVGIKPMGGLGKTQFVSCDITKKDGPLRAARGSDAIVNLCGAFADRGEEVNRDDVADDQGEDSSRIPDRDQRQGSQQRNSQQPEPPAHARGRARLEFRGEATDGIAQPRQDQQERQQPDRGF